MAVQRYRSYNWVMYPESLPADWMDVLDRLHVPIICAIHDQDVYNEADEAKNPDNKAGTLKKTHFHGMAMFEGKKSAKQMLEMLEPLGVVYVEPTHNVQSFTRYLLHMDNPEKAQYTKDVLFTFGGAVADFSRTIPQSEVQAIMCKICDFIRDNDVTEFYELWTYARENEPDWFTVLNNGKAWPVYQAIKSRRHSIKLETETNEPLSLS